MHNGAKPKLGDENEFNRGKPEFGLIAPKGSIEVPADEFTRDGAPMYARLCGSKEIWLPYFVFRTT